MLKSATGGVTLAYDPMLRLYDVTGAATTRFAYDGLDAIAEYDAANALQRRFVHGPGIDEPLVQYEGASTTDRRFLHADERGSVIATSDASGNMLTINKYDEFGKPQSTNAGRFQYTGQMWLPELGAYYYKARVYSATLGRFLQTDPIDVAGGINLYAYVGNDPVNWLDPLGLQTPPILTGWDPGCSICNATAFINGTDIVITAQASGGDGGAWLGGGMTGGVGNGRSPIAGFNPRGGGGGEARPQRNICRSAYSGANAVSDLAGDIALGADTVAMGAAVAAVITSETIVGGLTFGAIAAGAKLVSLGASGVRAVVQFTSGNNRGGQSTLIGLGIGVVTPPLLKAKQGIYGIGNSARDRLVQETHGIAAGELASEALCTGS